MVGFSERLGFKKPKMELQIDEVDSALFAGLWDALYIHFFKDIWQGEKLYGTYGYTDAFWDLSNRLWHHYFRKPIDGLPSDPKQALAEIRRHFLNSKFPETYNFLEFIASDGNNAFVDFCNRILEREKSAFRFVGQHLTQITNKTEIEEIEAAQDQDKSKPVSSHINAAVSLYSNREKPDYRNSIKESISAVEAAAKELAGPDIKTLGEALKVLGKDGTLHRALTNGYSSLYGWTNDSEGIRHALMDETTITEADARYMLVSCSAFANYLLSKI
ncbi:MAG: hypothetical protein KUG74_02205 [Rhodobacteraceae bacterium]|nr:hypothetical protein [Paracoccaceae bacterium]